MQKKLLRISVIVISTVLFATTFANVQASQGRYTVDQCQGELDRARSTVANFRGCGAPAQGNAKCGQNDPGLAQARCQNCGVAQVEARKKVQLWTTRLEAANTKADVHAQMGRK